MVLNATNSTVDSDINPAKRIKVSPVNDLVLQMFVESQWEKDEIKTLGEWLKSRGVDINNPAWYLQFTWSCEGSNATDEDIFKARVTTELKNILPFLIECQDNVNFSDTNGQTVLHVYLSNSESDYNSDSKSKIFKIVKSLMEHGASANAVDRLGKTPLHLAAENNKLEMVELMLDYFSNVNARDEKDNTVLHIVLERNVHDCDPHLNIVKSLLAKGADPIQKNQAGMTPLHLAVLSYDVDLLQIFKDNGADFAVTTDNNENPLLLAFKHNNFRIPAAEMLAIVNFLVDQGCDVNAQNEDGYTAAHYAVKWKTTLKRLVGLGVDVNYHSRVKRQTPLHLAVDMERWACDTVKTLYRAGADWDALDFKGRTPLDVALESEDSEMAERLLEFGGHTCKQDLSLCYRLLHLVQRYAMVMTAAGFRVRGVYETYAGKRYYRGRVSLHEKCLQEVEKMKAHEIGDDGTSIYEFLHMNARRQINYVDGLPRDLDFKFPFYADFIWRTRNEAVRRNQLLEPATRACKRIAKMNLPEACIERILHFLNNWDLRDLICAADA